MRRIRSPLQLVAMKFNNPEIMLQFPEHVSFDPISKGSGNMHLDGSLVASPWFRETTEYVRGRQRDPDSDSDSELPKVVPLQLYHDDVALGFGNNSNVLPIMMGYGNFSSKLQQHNVAKDVVAYVPSLGVSQALLFRHLQEKVGMAKTPAVAMIKDLKRQLLLSVMESIALEIGYGSVFGIEIPILGTGRELRLFTFISSLPADTPARCKITGVLETHCPNCFRGSKLNKFLPFSTEAGDRLRADMNLAYRCAEAVELVKKGRRRNKEERDLVNKLKDEAVRVEINPLHRAPFGVGGCLYTSCAPDIMHVMFGLAKIVMFDVLVIIHLIATSEDSTFSGAAAEFDRRIITQSHHFSGVKQPHVDNPKFPRGLMHNIAKKTDKKKDLMVSGNFGGQLKSSTFVAMLWQTFWALGSNGVLPSDPNYTFTDKSK